MKEETVRKSIRTLRCHCCVILRALSPVPVGTPMRLESEINRYSLAQLLSYLKNSI